jgi:predicted HicB family RNase H-like nuclease
MHFMLALDHQRKVRRRGKRTPHPEPEFIARHAPYRDLSMAVKAPAQPSAGTHAATAVLQVAERLYAMHPEWVVFFREVLGVDGIVRRTFTDPDALLRFECSPQYARIREMLDALRSRQRDQPSDRETQRVVTVRMPRSLHETLKAEAEQFHVSINTLCISKLMKLLDEQKHRDLTGGQAG